MNNKILRCRYLIISALLLCFLNVSIFPQDDSDEKEIFSQLRHTRRINAHGDEFTTMDMSPDKKRLAIGTEKGDVIIWSIETNKLEKQLSQGRPIHEIIFTGNDTVVIAGGNHIGTHNCLFGKLDIVTGRFEEWSGAGNNSLMYLSWDEKSGVIATSNLNGYVTAWDAATGKRKALWDSEETIIGLAVAGSSVYVSRTDIDISKGLEDDSEVQGEIVTVSTDDPKRSPKTFIPKKVGFATQLRFSPDKKLLVANLFQSDEPIMGFFDRVNGQQIASVDGSLNARWVTYDRVLLSDDEEPLKFCTIGRDGKITTDEISKGGGFHRGGTPIDVSGQAVSADERYVWHTYKKIGALAQFDLKTKESKLLIVLQPFPYAMDVREYGNNRGHIATAGDDKYVRVWNLSDLSLVKEIKTDTIPQGIALLSDGKRLVYSSSGRIPPTEIFTVDVVTGARKLLLSLDTPFVGLRPAAAGFLYEGRIKESENTSAQTSDKEKSEKDEPRYVTSKLILASAETGKTLREFDFKEGVANYANSHNTNWIGVADNKGVLWRINVLTGAVDEYKDGKIDDPTQMAITNDGRYIYTTEWFAKLTQWDTEKRSSKIIVDGFRGQASCLRLSVDEKFAIIGGNHYDIGVYEIATGRTGFYTRVDASDFYVPQAWMKGNRLVYITDGGVMFDAILNK